MIVKGAPRGGPKQLANYLMRVYAPGKGDKATLIEMHSPADNLVEAFRDWQVLAEGTRQGRDGLYHAQISPAPKYAQNMTPDQWKRAADLLGEELGLKEQPRALIVHEGDGRPHLHVVWQRTDIDAMKLISDSYNYAAHERASQRMELEFGQDFVPGKHAKRDRERQPEPPKEALSQTERMIAERTGVSKEERIAEVTALKQASDTGQAFKAALDDAGYVLASGDRGYVVVDNTGKQTVLSRLIDGMTAKDVKAFMADVPLETLPTIEQAKAVQAERREQLRAEIPKPQTPVVVLPEPPAAETALAPADAGKSKFVPELAAIPREEPAPQVAVPSPEELALQKALAERQDKEREKLIAVQKAEAAQTARALDLEQREKLAAIDAMQKAARDRLERDQKEQASGLKGLMQRLSPAKAARAAAERQQAMQTLLDSQATARAGRLEELNRDKASDIAEMRSRHEQQLREQAARFEQERERYVRDQLEAQRLRAEIEAERRQQEERQRREGPDIPPPKLVK